MVMKIVIFSGTMGDSWTSEQWRWSTFRPNIVFPSIFGLASTHFCSLIWTKYYSIFFLTNPTSLRTACGFFLPFQKNLRMFLPPKNGGFFGGWKKKHQSKPTRLGEVFQGVEFHVLVAVPSFVSQAKPMVTSGSGGVFFFMETTTKKSTWTEELWD